MSSMVRHVRPVAPRWARGVVADVYRHVGSEFADIGPTVRMASPTPEILAPGWALLWESRLAGELPLPHKLLAGLGVAQANRCGHDEDDWLAALRRAGAGELAEQVAAGGPPDEARLTRLFDWARATAFDPSARMPVRLRPKPAPELIGTVLFAHFRDRMSLAMLAPGLSPGIEAAASAPLWRNSRPVLRPGDTLTLLKRTGKTPDWGADSPVGIAYGALAANAARGAGMMSAEAAHTVTEVIAAYRGRIQPDPSLICLGELNRLSEADRFAARAAILAGLAPAELTDADVLAWRATDRHLSDHCTVLLLAYGAMTAVAHIEADIA
ncbi:hypothetical protein [Stackebrandtia nassauensis]|uniref:Uncharacterized protein n=1 Tax=Stackebrandtia nassauensis (strain DSM 44728 / CIP 108903 / NRRL B-16338 / NBRC 102104 / LLR-40K-21) TaxID=446470 RepID=D3PZZ5_STANL|nr:hypothetical protein [Stackebrandtia nassauensis]ADD45524.1 hypothetical protein Snas_5896 [Stackebrandtia nassauensis DSM 44728]